MTKKQLTLTINQPITMSSREIAQITGKAHHNVLRDIRAMVDSLGENNLIKFDCVSDYLDSKGQKQPEYNLPKRETLILISGYCVKLRARIIDRWQELENRLGGQIAAEPTLKDLAQQIYPKLEEQAARCKEKIAYYNQQRANINMAATAVKLFITDSHKTLLEQRRSRKA